MSSFSDIINRKVNPFQPGQSVGGGAYKGTPYDSKTGKAIVPSKSSSSSRSSSSQAQAQAEAQRQAQAEAIRQAEIQKEIVREQARINAEIKKLNLVRIYNSRDSKTGVDSKVKEYRKGSKLIREFTERGTGITRYEQYGAGRGGGSRQFQGSTTFQGMSSKDRIDISKELYSQGLYPVFDKGKLVGFRDKRINKTYAYTDKGIKQYNKDFKDIQKKIRFGENVKEIIKISSKDISTLDPKKSKILINYNFKTTKNSLKTTSSILRAVVISGRSIPRVLADYGISLGKGFTKIGLYAIDEAGYISQIKINNQTGKLYIPQGTKAITDKIKLGRVKSWVGYEFKNNPLKDPDFQNVAITTTLIGIGLASPGLAVKIFGAVKGKAIYDAVKNPTEYNIAVVESMFLPNLIKRTRKILARRDILVAKSGDLVPLKERIKQVDYAIKNSGRTIETITAKPSGKAKFTNMKSPKNPDYTYGTTIEFATYKVGRAYPTSEYFLSGKSTRLQKLLKTGRVNIQTTKVSNVNAKYGAYIRRNLLSKRGRVPESFIKKYYLEAKLEANRLGKPVAVISPKRLRGYWQPEQELVKVLPNRYVPKKLKFGGMTEEGYRVFTDKSRTANLKSFVKSKFNKGKIERSYFKELTKDKLEYLRGRKAIKGEYQEHGLKHLKAKELDPYSKRYAQRRNVKKFGNVFDKHDLAKVGDVESFRQFEHGQVLYNLWKKGQFPDKRIYKLPPKIQRQIAQAYAGHTPARPRFIDIFKKRVKGDIQANKVFENLKWYVRNKRNPYLQDVLTLDRLDLPRAGRWSYRVKYNLLDKNALKRIYGSELNAVKNIRFLDWKTVPGRLRRALSPKIKNSIMSRDRALFKQLRLRSNVIQRGLKNKFARQPLRSTYKSLPKQRPTRLIPYKTSVYRSIKKPSYKRAYEVGYKAGYKATYSRPTNYKRNYGKYQSTYAKGYADGYKGTYRINYKTGKYTLKYSTKYINKYQRGYKNNKYIGKYIVTRRIKKKQPIIKLPTLKSFKSKSLSSSQPTFYVVEKVRGRFKKLYPKPLTLKDARDYAVYSIDNRLSKTAFFVPLGKARRVVSPPKQIQNYASRNSFKVRPYRIRFGKKKQLVNGYIEKRRFFQDTLGERTQASRLRRMSRVTKRRTVSKMSPQRRRMMLANLKRVRAIRMRNLRR